MRAAPVAAPGLPPVIVGSRRAGDGRLFLNVGIDATNAALFAGERPGELGKVMPRWALTYLRIVLVLGAVAFAASFLPVDPYWLPVWAMAAWMTMVTLGGVAAVGLVVTDMGGAFRRWRHSRAIKAWRSQLESALYGHREQLLPLADLAERPQWPDVKDFIDSLDSARTRILTHTTGDRHDGHPAQTDLLHALGCVSRYAEDTNPTPGRRESAQNAVIRFQRAAIELTSHEGTGSDVLNGHRTPGAHL